MRELRTTRLSKNAHEPRTPRFSLDQEKSRRHRRSPSPRNSNFPPRIRADGRDEGEVSTAPRSRRSRTAAASAATCTDGRTDGRLDGRRAQTGTQFLRTRGEERGEDGSLLWLRSVTRAVRGCELGFLCYPEIDQTPDLMSDDRIGWSLLNPCTTSQCGKGVVGDCNGVIGVRLRSI